MISARSTLVGSLCGLLRRAETAGLYDRDRVKGEVLALRRYYRVGPARRGLIRRLADDLLRNLYFAGDGDRGRDQLTGDVEALFARIWEGDRAILRATARDLWGEPDERGLTGHDNDSGGAGSGRTASGHDQRLQLPGGSRGPSTVARPSPSAVAGSPVAAAEGVAEGAAPERDEPIEGASEKPEPPTRRRERETVLVGRSLERELIVAYLRGGAEQNPACARAQFAARLGDAIEKGAHSADPREKGGAS